MRLVYLNRLLISLVDLFIYKFSANLPRVQFCAASRVRINPRDDAYSQTKNAFRTLQLVELINISASYRDSLRSLS